jgi:Thoeris protein ThsA, Macro domain
MCGANHKSDNKQSGKPALTVRHVCAARLFIGKFANPQLTGTMFIHRRPGIRLPTAQARTMTVQSVNDLWFGVTKHKWKTVSYIFTCFSVLFTIVKVTTQFFPSIQISGPAPLTAAILISCGWSLKKVWKPSKTAIKIANCNTCLEIVFGDIFTQDGIRAIGVSEFFETQLGKPVSDKSLHGAFLKRHFSGYPDAIDKQIEKQLAQEKHSSVPDKAEGKTACYPIGTTALIDVNEDRYLLFALTKTNSTNCKVYSDVELMWRAMHKLWERARVECGGHPLNVPLIGSGLSGLNLPTRDLLNLIILSAITESKAHEVTQTIRVVLRRDRFEDIDLREVKKHWEEA